MIMMIGSQNFVKEQIDIYKLRNCSIRPIGKNITITWNSET